MSQKHLPQDDQAHDRAFFRTFGVVLLALIFIAGFCAFAASLIVPHEGKRESEVVRTQERIRPIGRVITDPALLVPVKSAVARAPLAADQVVATVCSACHGAGVLGAPKIGDKAAWGARSAAKGGIDGLTADAIKGIGQMPARGGNPDLSDEEIKAAVGLMLKNSGV